MSFTTDEVNLLVHRYLVESGYTHAAFTFYTEGGLDRTNLRAADVPPGALVAYLQKGLEYVSIEEHINEVRGVVAWWVGGSTSRVAGRLVGQTCVPPPLTLLHI